MKDFLNELKWRGLYYQEIPGVSEYLKTGKGIGYIGFDPTAPSLGIGNLVQIIILKHLQLCGHTPIAVIGGATGMIGDPSGKSAERNLLTEEVLANNVERLKEQLSRYLDFEDSGNKALLVNNLEFYKNMNVLTFLREVGKHITVNYMLAKDSVKSRLETGISYTEFSYQLLQGYDFFMLYKNYGCKLQLGGSDQWGNLTTGVEFIRRMEGGEAYAITTPLVTKSDGTKFGKSEQGNIYLDPTLTSPYRFYQFWLNVSDEEAGRYIKIFTFLEREEIHLLEREHEVNPGNRLLQKTLAREVTMLVHGKAAFEKSVSASEILFGKSTKEALLTLSEEELLDVFEGVPQFQITASLVEGGVGIMKLLVEDATVFPSKSELRRTIKEGGLSLNKEKVTDEAITVSKADFLENGYLLVQKGKKNFFLLKII